MSECTTVQGPGGIKDRRQPDGPAPLSWEGSGGRFASAGLRRQRDGGERERGREEREREREGGRRSIPDTERGLVHLTERERTSTPDRERED